MSKREATPDVMAELLGGSQQAKSEPQATALAPADDASTDVPPVEKKTKLTVYVSPSVNNDLEELRFRLRKLIQSDSLHDVTKSTITEAALAIAYRDFEANGQNAQIVNELS